jgi:ppGpp synthetase/RelA/SpoT-type nucleotidyltranferase
MKIPASIRALYAEQKEPNERLQRKVDDLLEAIARRNLWHYESRIKSEISVALKIESGRVTDPRHVEDFFACAIVVRNLSEIEQAEKIVYDTFTLEERRPKRANQTHKNPDSFPFDDVRLYVHWKDDPTLPATGLEQVRFEVQIKTFLQHAWGIATHDLVYKTDDVDWSKERIAFQIKAMLEHAEVSIQEAGRLAGTAALAKTHKATQELKDIIAFLKDVWTPDFLPSDLRRLAENTRSLLKLTDIRITRLRQLIVQEKQRNRGDLPLNISPYGIMVQALAWGEAAKLRAGLANNARRERLLVTNEMELPDWVYQPEMINVVRI